jgi:hypothetical protein
MKTSKLLTTYGSDWNRLLCNACYGRLLAIHEIQAGTAPDDEKANELASLLLRLFQEDVARKEAQEALDDPRLANQLSPLALRFIGTSELVAGSLSEEAILDWSSAILGLCKAFELELVIRLVDPLKSSVTAADLSKDRDDPDLSRVTRYCLGRAPAPELGSIGHFVRTAVSSRKRSASSPMIQGFNSLIERMAAPAWVSEELPEACQYLALRFRNPAVHLEELDRAIYQECRAIVLGPSGLLSSMFAATRR